MGCGDVTFSAKRSYLMQWGMQYAVDVGAKRSTHTVFVANMGGGDHYLSCKKVKPHAVMDAVRSRCCCKKVNSHLALSKYGWCGMLPLVQKGQTQCSEDVVCSRCWCKKVNSHSVLFAPMLTAYCIPHCVEFDLLALKVTVPTTHICLVHGVSWPFCTNTYCVLRTAYLLHTAYLLCTVYLQHTGYLTASSHFWVILTQPDIFII